jgi:undecaprenyl-diphosphatase
VLHAIVLGITQGLTEFLPISSSGHLVLLRWLLRWGELGPDLAKTFDVALHLGTFAGAAAYFRDDICRYTRAGWRLLRRRGAGPDGRTAGLLAVSALPAAVVGGAAGDAVENHLGQVWLIAAMLAVFGLVLLWADRLPGRRAEKEFGLRDALVMGTAQALALQPGVSRSGVTISAARWLAFDRDAAARLSFLMSLPVILGAGLYKAAGVVAGPGIPGSMVAPFVWGTLTAGLSGFVAVWAILRLVRTRSFGPFVAYRVVAAVAVLALFAARS